MTIKTIGFQKAIRLPHENGALSDVVRVNNHWISARSKKEDKFFRNDLVLIRNNLNGSSVICHVVGSAGITGLTKSTIAMNYDTAVELGIDFDSDDPLDLSIEPASNWRLGIKTLGQQGKESLAIWLSIIALSYSLISDIISLVGRWI